MRSQDGFKRKILEIHFFPIENNKMGKSMFYLFSSEFFTKI